MYIFSRNKKSPKRIVLLWPGFQIRRPARLLKGELDSGKQWPQKGETP